MTGIINIREYERLSEGGSNWTEAFRAAVAAAAQAGGAMIFVPAGEYPTYPIRLESNMTLYLCAGARLSFIQNMDGYELIRTEFEGIAQDAHMACIFADHAHHVALKGDGIIDGGGEIWWKAVREGTLAHPRPYLICFQYCANRRSVASEFACMDGASPVL